MKISSAVIFDMDGVLADTEPIYMAITRDMLAKLEVPLAPEELFAYVGIPTRQMWTEIISRFDLHLPLNE
ncbi:MAG: HAD family phosphatase, partial [Deltaproteobacteria bacterium]|nr:HAD family phosphatase [Deltaproteobacteria bacterium]